MLIFFRLKPQSFSQNQLNGFPSVVNASINIHSARCSPFAQLCWCSG